MRCLICDAKDCYYLVPVHGDPKFPIVVEVCHQHGEPPMDDPEAARAWVNKAGMEWVDVRRTAQS